MNRLERLISLIILLQSKKIIRGKDIAKYFGISLRTVYRDINAVCEAGLPVAAEAGEGYSLIEGYHLPPVMFTRDEATALFTGVRLASQLTDESIKQNAASALLKIQSVLPDTAKEYLEKVNESTALYIQSVSKKGFKKDVLIIVQDAVVNKNVLKIEYYSINKNKVTSREIEPLGIVYYSNRWHIIAWCRLRKDLRDFRADSLKSVIKMEEVFKKRDGLSIKDYFKTFGQTDQPQEVKLRLGLQAAQSIRDKLYTSIVDEKKQNDKVIFTLLTAGFEWLIPLLLAYRTSVEVLSPRTLKDTLATIARQVADHHS